MSTSKEQMQDYNAMEYIMHGFDLDTILAAPCVRKCKLFGLT